jgi:hypothetical protein
MIRRLVVDYEPAIIEVRHEHCGQRSRIANVVVTDETITATVDGVSSACPLYGHGPMRRQHNARIGSSLATATAFIGLTSMRTSARKACSTAFRHIAQ